MLRWIALVLIVILIGLQLRLWVGNGSMHEVDALRVAVKKQSDENARLRARNEALGADVVDLKHGDQAVEARARTELGLIKPGEIFYQVVEKPAGASTTLPPLLPAKPAPGTPLLGSP
ncbi:MAG: cell division protein FtsB [Rhodanobacter sp.]|nr:MAG: cell division protein FtsB [Rhodanobacter sp.]